MKIKRSKADVDENMRFTNLVSLQQKKETKPDRIRFVIIRKVGVITVLQIGLNKLFKSIYQFKGLSWT